MFSVICDKLQYKRLPTLKNNFCIIFCYQLVEEAAYLLKTTRILCYVMLDSDTSTDKFTGPFYSVDGYTFPSLSMPDEAISNTWATKCSKIVFFSSRKGYFSTPSVKLKTKSGIHSWDALREAIMHLSKNYLNDFNWFLGVQEDTFVIMENLAYFLSVYNSSLPWYFGHGYTAWGYSYNVAGAGAVLSNGALRRLSNKLAKGHCSGSSHSGDQSMAQCLSELGVQAQDTRDHLGRATFLAFRPESHLVPGSIPWSQKYWTESSYLSAEVSSPAAETVIWHGIVRQ